MHPATYSRWRPPRVRARQPREVIGRMRSPRRLELTAGRKLLEPEFADRLEHGEPRLSIRATFAAEQVLVDKRDEPVQSRSARLTVQVLDRLGRIEPAATDEHSQAAERA